jgi:hypothetical protein
MKMYNTRASLLVRRESTNWRWGPHRNHSRQGQPERSAPGFFFMDGAIFLTDETVSYILLSDRNHHKKKFSFLEHLQPPPPPKKTSGESIFGAGGRGGGRQWIFCYGGEIIPSHNTHPKTFIFSNTLWATSEQAQVAWVLNDAALSSSMARRRIWGAGRPEPRHSARRDTGKGALGRSRRGHA